MFATTKRVSATASSTDTTPIKDAQPSSTKRKFVTLNESTAAAEEEDEDEEDAALAAYQQWKQKQRAKAIEEEENDDPFADVPARPIEKKQSTPTISESDSTLVSPLVVIQQRLCDSITPKRSSRFEELLMPDTLEEMTTMTATVRPTSYLISSYSTKKRTKVMTSSDSTDSSESSETTSSPSPSAAAAFITSDLSTSSSLSDSPTIPTPTAAASVTVHVHQTRVDDIFDAVRPELTPLQKQVQRQQVALGRTLECRYCRVWLGDTTLKDHERVCQQKIPPPLTFFSTPTAAEAGKHLQMVQSLATYNTHAWNGSQLLRVTYAQFKQARGVERRRYILCLRWLVSVLNSMEGRNLATPKSLSQTKDQDGDEEMTEEKENLDDTIEPGQELWIHLMKSNGGYVVSCVVLINTQLSSTVMTVNTEETKLKQRSGPQQTSLMEFMKSKQIEPTLSSVKESTTTTVASTSSNSSISVPGLTSSSTTLPPIFGVDKIAVHSRYRFGASSSTAPVGKSFSTPAATSPPTSLAIHVLTSILSSMVNPGISLPYGRVAFSSTTRAGRYLAVRFTQSQSFLTYALH